jgi:hypothetical protein
MRPGREVDATVAQEVLGYTVKVKKKELWEVTPKGERPLRKYSKDIGAAWEVVEKLNMTLISIENGQWFALVGLGRAWKNPAEFLLYLQSGQFAQAGAAVGEDAPMTVCLAAIKALKPSPVIKSATDAVSRAEGTGESQNLHH